MKKTLLVAIGLMALMGCARFSTTQIDFRDETTTTITTKAASWTFFESKSTLAKWKALQSEKSQGAEVGGLAQSSSATTNLVDLIKAVTEGVVKGLKP